MKIEADLHNFGRSVQRIQRGSGVYFRKPRPIYWEHLFFGTDSPLIPYFSCPNRQRWAPADFLFNLKTEMSEDFKGDSKEVSADAVAPTSDSHFYSLGVLLAYCYVFGIRDLHRSNIVKTKTHLQVIDAEVVLSKLLLPHETLLLPFKEVGPDLCGAAHLEWTNLAPLNLKVIFDGYMDTFNCLLSNQEAILSDFQALSDRLEAIPVRHILRDTFHYRDRHLRSPETPFFSAEQRQLDRGDIPYFFKFIGSDTVFEYTSPTGSYDRVELPDTFLKGAAREAALPAKVLAPGRLSELLPTGLLYLAKKLFSSSWISAIEGEDFTVSLSESSITVTLPQRTYSSRR